MSDKNPQNELRSGIEGYDPKQMKKVVTKEKNPLPTQCQIDEEKKAQMCPEKSKK